MKNLVQIKNDKTNKKIFEYFKEIIFFIESNL